MVAIELRHPWFIGPADLEGTAQAAHDGVEAILCANPQWAERMKHAPGVLFLPPELLAAILGYTVVDEAHARHEGQLPLFARDLYVRASRCDQKRNLRILHELAHALLKGRARGTYTHGDVWALTLMLAIPQRLLRHADLARHVPKWVGKMRRALAILAIQAA